MMKMKCLQMSVVLLVVGFLSMAQGADYPTKDLLGVIQWGAGGACDNISRAVTPFVEKQLGKQVVLQNKPGATGAVAVQWVHNQPSDGYTLLYTAENPALYRVLDISQLEFKDFYPISIIARDIAVVVCNVDQPWKNISELVADAKEKPGQIKMASTGTGGRPHVVAAMFKTVTGVSFNQIPFPGEGPAITAVMGGHSQFTIAGLFTAREHIRAGRVRALGMVSDTPVAGFEEVPLVTSTSADFKKFLPWGSFYAVSVKKDTPDEVKKTLVAAYQNGLKDPKAQEFIKNFSAIYMGIHGAEAEKFIKHWQSVTAWTLNDAGATAFSPEKFGIPRP